MIVFLVSLGLLVIVQSQFFSWSSLMLHNLHKEKFSTLIRMTLYMFFSSVIHSVDLRRWFFCFWRVVTCSVWNLCSSRSKPLYNLSLLRDKVLDSFLLFYRLQFTFLSKGVSVFSYYLSSSQRKDFWLRVFSRSYGSHIPSFLRFSL